MNLTLDKDLPTSTLHLKGNFQFGGRPVFQSATDDLLALPGRRDLTLDLSAVSFMDSASLGMLLVLREKAEALGRKVVIQNPSPTVQNILSIVHFERLFEIKGGEAPPADGACG